MSTIESTTNSDNDAQINECDDPERLRKLYWERGLSLADIGKQAGVSGVTIRRWMKKYEIPRRKANSEKPPHLRETERGYLRILTSNPDGGLDSVYVHRLVAVAEHGYEAVCDNHVHHKSGHGFDNRHDNLAVLSPTEHAREHNLGKKRDEKGRFT